MPVADAENLESNLESVHVETVSNTGSCDLVDSTIVASLVHLGQGYFDGSELSGELLQHCPGSAPGTILEKFSGDPGISVMVPAPHLLKIWVQQVHIHYSERPDGTYEERLASRFNRSGAYCAGSGLSSALGRGSGGTSDQCEVDFFAAKDGVE